MPKKFYLKDWHGKEKEFTDEKIFVRGENGELIQFTQGTGGSSSADVRYVTFMSYDGLTEYGKKAVAVGDDCADPIARGVFATPTREYDENVYYFTGWATSVNGDIDTNALKSVTENKTVYAAYDSYAILSSGSCGDNVTYRLSSDGVMVISGEGAMSNYTTANIPWRDYANNVESVIIENGVTSIGNYTFYGCTNLTSINIPDGMTSIGTCAFYNCTSLTSVNIPDGMTSIGVQAFINCTNLTSINIPASVTTIGGETFKGCTNLATLDIDVNNESYCVVDGILYNIDKTVLMFGMIPKVSGSLTIPNSVTKMESDAFSGCTKLTSVTIPSSLTTISTRAFYNCTSLTSITIPDSVTTINGSAFSGCTKLTSVTFAVTSGWTASFWGTSYSLTSSQLSNKSTAATYLKDTYSGYTWTRT